MQISRITSSKNFGNFKNSTRDARISFFLGFSEKSLEIDTDALLTKQKTLLKNLTCDFVSRRFSMVFLHLSQITWYTLCTSSTASF